MTVRTFDEVAVAQLPGLLRYATVLTGRTDQAEDLVQDVLTHALEKWDRVGAADNPAAYLTRMLTNRFLSGRRKRPLRLVSLSFDLGDRNDHVGAVADRSELRSLLARLPARQRAALVLRYYLGFPDEESARMLGCKESSFRSLCSRGLAALQQVQESWNTPLVQPLRKAEK